MFVALDKKKKAKTQINIYNDTKKSESDLETSENRVFSTNTLQNNKKVSLESNSHHKENKKKDGEQ